MSFVLLEGMPGEKRLDNNFTKQQLIHLKLRMWQDNSGEANYSGIKK